MKRKNNYDLLRIISAVAVIMIHVSATWFTSAVNRVAEYDINIREIQAALMICVYNSISRFAVPCFIMLSGALILDDKKNAEYKYFYSKSFAKIGVLTIIFSILYRIPFCFTGENKGMPALLGLLKNILKGSPMYHMWYLYMLIGIYVLAPVVVRFKESITENIFYKISFIFLILASLSHWIAGEVPLNWDIGQSFEYLGYFMAGYSVRRIFTDRKNNGKAFILILSGIFLEICAMGFSYKQMTDGIHALKYEAVTPYSPIIVIASVCIFIGFTVLDIKKEYADMASISFYIYLIHAGVWDFINIIFRIAFGRDYLTGLNGGTWIPLFAIAVFGSSYVLSKLYLWIWNKLDKERRITNYMIRVVRL